MYKVVNVKKNFKDKIVFDEVSFSINQGDIIALIGRNGAGKTTLVKLLSNTLSPTSGSIQYLGKDLSQFGNEYFNEISLMFEGGKNLYSYLTAIENVLYFGSLYKMSKKEILSKVDNLFNRFDLEDVKNDLVSTFSKGMRHKLSLIICLLSNPKVIFLDEPTLGLDIISKRNLINIVEELNREGITFIVTSHEFGFIEEIATKLFLIENNVVEEVSNISKFIKENVVDEYTILFEGDYVSQNTSDCFEKDGDITKLKITASDFSKVLNTLEELSRSNCKILDVRKNQSNLETIFINKWRSR